MDSYKGTSLIKRRDKRESRGDSITCTLSPLKIQTIENDYYEELTRKSLEKGQNSGKHQ